MIKILSIARYTFIGTFRNKIFWILILFGFMMLGSSILFGLLSQEQEIRMLVDLGLATIEILTFIAAVFLMVNLVLEEAESKTIYLVLTRSVEKREYLLGKFLGAIAALLVCMIIMTAGHLILLAAKGWKFTDGTLYAFSIFASFEKIFLISSLTLFFSLFSSSAIAALVFSFFFWILGHFALELRFLASEIHSESLRWLVKGIYLLIPHFQYLNARDLWVAVSNELPQFIIRGTLYTIAYSACLFLLTLMVFRKKEF